MTATSSTQDDGLVDSPPNVTLTHLIVVLTIGLICWGWIRREEYWIQAEDGLGYAFGIAGAVLMILLMLYPLSKKISYLRDVVASRFWFKGHMFLGISGPLFILFHCNFGTGSANSTVALFSMIVVVVSGLIGRYIYKRTHRGLYGHKLSYEKLRTQHERYRQQLQQSATLHKKLSNLMSEVEVIANNPGVSLVHSWFNLLAASRKSRQVHKHLSKGLKKQNFRADHPVMRLRENIHAEITVLESMASLSFYDKLFSIWHVLHLPFFYMLIVTAVIHVIAVHLY